MNPPTHPEIRAGYQWEEYGPQPTAAPSKNVALVDSTGKVRAKITWSETEHLWTVNRRARRVVYRRMRGDEETTDRLLRGSQFLDIERAKLAVENAEAARLANLNPIAQPMKSAEIQ